MADLMFKRGKQPNLPSLADNGCFYLTTDTNRLYVGNENNEMVLLSQNIQIIESIENLPAAPYANEFYYCSKDNVFAFYDGSSWQQINPDTNDNDNDTIEVTGLAFERNQEESSEDQVVYTLTLDQTKTDINGNPTVLEALKAQLVLNSSDIASIVPEAATVGLQAKTNGTGISIATEGDGSDPENAINLLPGDNVTAITTDDGTNITIDVKDTVYSFGVTQSESSATLEIANDDGPVASIEFAASADNDDLIVSAETDKVIYAHKTYEAPDVTSVTNNTDLSAQGDLHIISGLTLSNGHIVDIATETLTLPDDTHIEKVEHAEEAWKAIITETGAGNTYDIDFSADALSLENDLKKMITDGLAAANTALTYKGTISQYSDLLDKTDVEVGDVWLLDRDSTYLGESYKAGDMFIATTTDPDAAGKLDYPEWTYIPSGDELNTDTRFYGDVEIENGDATSGGGKVTYTLKAEENTDGTENIPDANEALSLEAGTDIVITAGDGNAAIISHKEYDSDVVDDQGQLDDATSITAITELTVENGHITGAVSKTFNVITYELTGAENQIQLSDANGTGCGTIAVESNDWIEATVEENVLTINHNAPQTATNVIEATNSDEQLSSGATVEFISKVSYDDAGHVVEVATDSVVLPESKTYAIGISSSNTEELEANDINDPYIILKDDDGNLTSVQAQGDSTDGNGSVAVVGTTTGFKVSLVWGSF